MDGLPILFLSATAQLFGIVMLASWNGASACCCCSSATQGVFMALDTVLFQPKPATHSAARKLRHTAIR
jgi:hypothetical protein